jgi:hypothetical protein
MICSFFPFGANCGVKNSNKENLSQAFVRIDVFCIGLSQIQALVHLAISLRIKAQSFRPKR